MPTIRADALMKLVSDIFVKAGTSRAQGDRIAESLVGANLTGLGPDDPDANFYENYGCGSPRNYSGYCNEEIQKLIDAQSAELDPKKRVALIARIQKQLEDEAEGFADARVVVHDQNHRSGRTIPRRGEWVHPRQRGARTAPGSGS